MKSATAYKRQEGIYLHGHCRTTVGLRIATPPFIKVGAEETLLKRGEQVLRVLNASMTTTVPHPKQEDWDGVFAPVLQLAGVKSLRAFEKGAVCCGLDADAAYLTITPMTQIRPGHGYRASDAAPVKLPFDSPPVEVAAALDEAFIRCD